MAAIQTLMINESPVPKDRPNPDAQTTPKTSPRMASTQPTDTTTASEPSTEPISTQDTSESITNDALHPILDPERPPEAPGETQIESAMDIDQPDDDPDDSDNETETGEGGSSRKKKGQRFFCTGYPPCNLSFTRSEHLARHIRKHTGERPFQCHCNRRFSRLDNLRQHAQTVHVNEEIPGDSLAATGTRYQRQIRTDRVRPTPKPRSSTISSTGSHSRGHSRNLSTSSIGSTTSTYSTTSDARRRPPPLLMAGERPSTPPLYSTYAANSPGDMGTPTSSTYPATPGSPNFSSALGSPVSNASRMTTVFAGARPPGRRLSVPSSAHPFANHGVGPYSASYNGPGPAMSSSSSIAASPVASNFGYAPAYNASPGDDWRRRTWHPSTFSNANINYNRPATSGLTYSSTPDAPHGAPAHNAHAAAGQAQRLPGIESFDHVAQQRPPSPPKRNASPLHPDPSRPALLAAPELDSNRRQYGAWEASRPSQYPEIDDATGRPATSWAQHGIDQTHGLGHHRHSSSTSSMGPPPPTAMMQQSQQIAQEALYLQSSNKRAKRNGWHQGRPASRPSPEDSSSSDGVPTPGTSTVDLHPAIVTGHGLIEPQLLAADTQNTQPCLPSPIGVPGGPGEHRFRERTTSMSVHSTGSSELNRLEALVAVATSESSQSATHRR